MRSIKTVSTRVFRRFNSAVVDTLEIIKALKSSKRKKTNMAFELGQLPVLAR